MKITIERKYKKEDYTIGSLFINGQWICNTLEPRDRGLKQSMTRLEITIAKVFRETAIPCGSYRVVAGLSTKFRARRPYVMDVPGFSGIMIHEGNTVRDTTGCILVGKNTVRGRLTESRQCLGEVMSRVLDAEDRGEVVMITVR